MSQLMLLSKQPVEHISHKWLWYVIPNIFWLTCNFLAVDIDILETNLWLELRLRLHITILNNWHDFKCLDFVITAFRVQIPKKENGNLYPVDIEQK